MTTRAGFLKCCLAVLGGLVVGLRKPEAVTDPAPMATQMENAFGDVVPEGYVLLTYANVNQSITTWDVALPHIERAAIVRHGNGMVPRLYGRLR